MISKQSPMVFRILSQDSADKDDNEADIDKYVALWVMYKQLWWLWWLSRRWRWSGWRIALVESCHPVICEGRTLFDSSSQLTTTYKDLLSPPLVICYLPACYSLSLLLLLIIFSWPHLLMACARDNDIQSQTQLWAQEERQRICHKIDYCEFGPQCVYPGILSNLLFSTYHSDFDRSGVSEKEVWNMWEIKGMEGLQQYVHWQ